MLNFLIFVCLGFIICKKVNNSSAFFLGLQMRIKQDNAYKQHYLAISKHPIDVSYIVILSSSGSSISLINT